jgi:hypothetical protein
MSVIKVRFIAILIYMDLCCYRFRRKSEYKSYRIRHVGVSDQTVGAYLICASILGRLCSTTSPTISRLRALILSNVSSSVCQ